MSKSNTKNRQLKKTRCEFGRGVIQDNFLAAVVTSTLFKPQIVLAKKGKGSYQRTQKHKGQKSYLMAS